MKTGKKIFLLFISLLIFVAACGTAFLLRVFPQGSDENFVSSVIYALNPYKDQFSIKVGSADKGIFNSVKLNDVSISSVDGQEIAQIGSIRFSDGILDLAKVFSDGSSSDKLEIYLEDVTANYLDASVVFPKAIIDVSLENNQFKAVNAGFTKLEGSYSPLNLSGEFETFVFGYNSNKDLSVISDSSDIDFNGKQVSIKDLKLYTDITQIQIKASKLSSTSLLEEYFKQLEFNNLNANLLVGEYYSIALSSLLKGQCREELIGDFSTQISLKDRFKPSEINKLLDFAFNSSLELSLLDTSIAALENPIDVSIIDDYKKVDLKISNDNDISVLSNIDINGFNFSANLLLNDFKPSDYQPFIDNFYPNLEKFYNKDSSVSGVFSVTGLLNQQEPEFNFAFDASVTNFKFNSQNLSFSFLFDGFAKDRTITAKKALLNYQGFVFDFSGFFNTDSFIPGIKLSIRQENDNSDLLKLETWYNSQSEMMEYSAKSSKYDYGSVSGEFSFIPFGITSSNSVFETAYQSVDFDFTLDLLNQKVEINHPKASFSGSYKNFVLEGGLTLNNPGVSITKDFEVVLGGTYKGFYNFKSGEYHGTVDDSRVILSDYVSLGFDLDIRNNKTVVSQIVLGQKEKQIEYDGIVDFSYISIRDFIYNQKRLNFDLNLAKRGTKDFIQASLIDNSYSVKLNYNIGNYDLAVDLLGTRGIGFYANSKVNNLSFEAHYLGKVLELYNGYGSIANFDLNEFDFIADFAKRTLDGTVSLEKVIHNHEGDVKRGGRINIGAKLDSIVISNLSVSGIDAKAEFEIGIEDAFIGEDFPLKDTKFNLKLENKRISAEGDLINGYFDTRDMSFALDVNPDLLFGFKSNGSIGKDLDLDVSVSDVSFPIPILNQFINWPFFQAKDGYLTGNVLVKGSIKNPSFYGMLYAKSFDMGLLWIPFQTLSLKSVSIFLQDHDIKLMPVSVVGYSTADGRVYTAKYSVDLNMDKFKVQFLSMKLNIDRSPIDFWLPIKSNGNHINFRGDVSGDMEFNVVNGVFKVNADLFAENSELSFEFPDFTPNWYYDFNVICDTDMNITTGKNVEFYYPNKDNYFLNFTTEEGNIVNLKYDSTKNEAQANGKFTFKNGEIYYIQNTFKITDGNISMEDKTFALDLRAKLREYDSNGKPNDIYLVLNHSTLDDIAPKFESSNGLSENEIIQLLGQSVVGANGQEITASTVASFAAAATDTVKRLGLIQLNSDYSKSLTSAIRDSLKLDVFSIRSQILENIVVEALPGFNHNVSLLSRYLNGTSIFAGKYLPGNTFARVSALLRSVNSSSDSVQFLTDDLVLDFEFSLDWENPMGEFSVFVQPTELSVINFLDNIGFSFTKTFKF